MTQQAKSGDTVRVHYIGMLTDDTVFDTSEERGPIEFTIGEGRIIAGFEDAVVGMEPGEKKREVIPCNQAYGEHRDDLVQTVERKHIPDEIDLKVGQQLQVSQPNDQPLVMSVVEITEEKVSLDANHPLAGKDLVFDIELVDIVVE